MLEKKIEGADTRRRRTKKITKFTLLIMSVTLLLLCIGGFFSIMKGKGSGVQVAINRQTPLPTTTPPSIYLETPPVQSEFYDTFKNNAQDWSVSSTSGYYRTIKPGELILTNTNPGTTMVESLPTNLLIDNGTLIVDFTIFNINLDDSIGIYVRGDTNLEHDYRIDINGNGTFDIAKEYLDPKNNPQSELLVRPKSISSLNPQGESNIIAVTMNGSHLQMFVNNEKVCVVSDSDYTQGQVALFARLGESPQKVVIAFSKVEVDKISRTLAGAGYN